MLRQGTRIGASAQQRGAYRPFARAAARRQLCRAAETAINTANDVQAAPKLLYKGVRDPAMRCCLGVAWNGGGRG